MLPKKDICSLYQFSRNIAGVKLQFSNTWPGQGMHLLAAVATTVAASLFLAAAGQARIFRRAEIDCNNKMAASPPPGPQKIFHSESLP